MDEKNRPAGFIQRPIPFEKPAGRSVYDMNWHTRDTQQATWTRDNVFQLDGKIALANKWAKNGVNVNTIAHGYMATDGGCWLTR